MVDARELISVFQERYGRIPRVFRAPGRVNLIGEHTDYNDGFVLPMAIDRDTAVAIAPRPDRILRVWSLNLNDSVDLDSDNLGKGCTGRWTDYVEGIAAALAARGVPLAGADIALKSDVGIGSGLSSSAALEISLGAALAAIAESPIDGLSLARAGQTAEHRHVGTLCGLMDQYISVYARKGHAILLDCRSLESRQIPLRLAPYQIVICDSRIRHALAASEYNRRQQDCRTGVQLLQSALPHIRALRDVSIDQLDAHRPILSEAVYRRCRHVVTENERTVQASEALIAGDAASVGRLMSASHRSLRDDYGVSCRELDILVECAESRPGVLGARMTGGGFGGCTVNLVETGGLESFSENMARAYHNKTGIMPEILAVRAAAGAEEIAAG